MRTMGLMACVVVMCGVTGGVQPVGAARSAAAKAAIKCRTLVGQRSSVLVNQTLAKLDGCHLRRDKGGFSGDCNRLDLSAARQKLAKALGKVCGKAPDVLANYAGGDVAGAIVSTVAGNLEDSGRELQGSPALGNDKKKIKCHGAIGKGRSNVVKEMVRRSTACQRGLDKRASAFAALALNCAVSPGSAGRALGAITRACSGIAGQDVGSCASLPGCAVDSATITGRRIASALYSRAELPPECHNGVLEPGEVCETPVDTPDCVNCKGGNSCGDGLVSGNEECDDANAVSGDGCSATCQVELPPGGFLVTVVVSIDFDPQTASDVAGVEIQLDYAPGKVGIPGTGNVPAAEGRVRKLGTAPNLEVADVNDQYLKIVYVGTDATAVQPGDLARILMDGLPGAVVGAGDFTCAVTLFTDSQGVTFPGSAYGITCAVAVTSATVTPTTVLPPTTAATTTVPTTTAPTTSTTTTTATTSTTSTTGGGPVCGNGIQEVGEECDDANGENTDACTNICRNAVCGDGFTRTGVEQCDVVPAIPLVCQANCMWTPAVCGDGVRQFGETCDDGNTLGGDVCPADCHIAPCPPTATRVGVSVSYAKQTAVTVGSLTLFLKYPDGTVGLPGLGNANSVRNRISGLPSTPPNNFSFTANDLDYALRMVISPSTVGAVLSPGLVFQASFDLCLNASVPSPAQFTCTVEQAATPAPASVDINLGTNPMSCSLTIP